MYINPFLLAEKVLVGTEKLNGIQIAAMTIIGLLVVFAALCILVVFLYSSGSFFKKAGSKPVRKAPVPQAKPAVQKPAVQKKPAPAVPAAPKAPAANAEDDSEIVAVIMAAIAAMGAAEGKNYKLKSVKQVTRGGSGRSVWAQAGLADATRPF